jgi:RNA polymerase sigma factor (sigma-70 family)
MSTPREHAGDPSDRDAEGASYVRTREEGERLFIVCLPVVQRVTAAIARRFRLAADEAEEFTSIAQMRLIDDDYAILRKFQGRSTLRTFLTVVVARLFLDYRIALWGKFRPSSVSRRHGKFAVLFERLLVRDGFTFEEAYQALQINYGIQVERSTLERLAAHFPRRERPRLVTDENLDDLPAPPTSPDAALIAADRQHLISMAVRELAAALAAFPPTDRLILKLRFSEDLSVADIARMLHLDARPLYKRLPRLLHRLRAVLDARGLQQAEMMVALASIDEWLFDPSGEDAFGGGDEHGPSPSGVCNVA